MKAPFPWFGGKRKVAPVVWAAFGDVDNYVEPFAGSMAVLLERPRRHRGIATGAETVNDADRYLANFWRAVSAAPEEVAGWADWPVNECDLFARHLWLVNEGRERLEGLDQDPDFFDAKVAGWWVWGQCAWIGSGWCSGEGPWTKGDAGQGVNRKLPHLGNTGRGVNRKLPHLGNTGRGVNRKLPHLGSAGQGVNRKRPHLGDAGQGVNRQCGIYDYMAALQARLRRVRVCCGDWSRVVTPGALAHGATIGVLLDPPYSGELRDKGCYSTDDHEISVQVRDWALEAAARDLRLRIALCGYEGEHDMPGDWRVHAWQTQGGYGNSSNGTGRENRHKERIWFSPSCLSAGEQLELFALGETC